MFHSLEKGTLKRGLETYLETPTWSHAVDVVPLLVWLGRNAPPWPPAALPEEPFWHLVSALCNWSAFRGQGKLKEKISQLHSVLPRFVEELKLAIVEAGGSCLVDLKPQGVSRLAEVLPPLFRRVGSKVKRNESDVLPSKVAHLLFPSIVPAYDQAVIRNDVLRGLLPQSMYRRFTYATRLRTCWWILNQLRQSGLLRTARRQVNSLLIGAWPIRMLREPKTTWVGPFPLTMLDTFIAEYLCIGLTELGIVLKPTR